MHHSLFLQRAFDERVNAHDIATVDSFYSTAHVPDQVLKILQQLGLAS